MMKRGVTQHEPIVQPVKIFVGGITGDTTRGRPAVMSEDLIEYFSRFADVLESFIVYENSSVYSHLEKSAGFGFITVNNRASANLVLSLPHTIRNTRVAWA